MHLNRRRLFLHLSATVIGATLVATSVMAQTEATSNPTDGLQQYDVELIFFSVTNPTGSPEEWAAIEARMLGAPLTAPTESTDPAPRNSTLPVATTSFPPLDAARFKMTAIAASLHRSKSYQLLGHIGWTQPGYPLEMALPVNVAQYLPADSVISGSVALARGRYLHLTASVVYQSPEGQRYILREQRRMQRSGEKHYLDHPRFGVIAVVTARN